MDSFILWAAIAAVSGIAVVVTSIVSGSGAAVSRGRQAREGEPAPGGREPGIQPANQAPAGVRMVQLASMVILAVSVVVLIFLLFF